MPGFDPQSIARIDATVRGWEGRDRGQRESGPRYENPQPFRWFELQEALDAGGEAEALMCEWQAEGTYEPPEGQSRANAGKYHVLEGTTYSVRDTTGQQSAAEGDWVLCRPIGSVNGTVWEMLPNGGALETDFAILGEDIPAGGSGTATRWVKLPSPPDGTWDPSGETVTVYAPPGLPGYIEEYVEGATVLIVYMPQHRGWYITAYWPGGC